MSENNKIVKVLIGSHGSGKSKWLYDYLIEKSRREDDNTKVDLSKKIYLVVPEQDTNDKQRIMMNKIGEKGYGSGLFNIDVVSFDRLAYTVFERLGISTESVIDDSGKTMILSIVISELKDKLKYYGKMSNRMGFAKKMTQAMSEFYAYNMIKLDESNNVIKDENDEKSIYNLLKNGKDIDGLMRDKLEDLAMIYEEFVKKLKEYNYTIREDKYDLLFKNLPKLKEDSLFKDAIFAFEGFTGFTPIQLNIFGELVKMASETYVVIDYRGIIKSNSELQKIYSKLEKNDVFYLSKKFLFDINKKLKEIDNASMIENIDYNKNNENYKYINKDNKEEKTDLKNVELYLYNYNGKDIKTSDIKPKNIELYEAKSAEDEIISVAHIIKNEIKNNNKLRYSDIKIVVPNVEDYSKKISNIFKKYDIPIYVDNSKSILNSPYIEAIRASLDVVTYNFSYDSIMRYINAGIFYKNSSIFEIDNFIREYGIRGYDRYKSGIDAIFDNQIKFINDQKAFEKDDKKIKELDDRIKSISDKKARIIKAKEELFTPLINLYNNIKGKAFDKKIISYLDAINKFVNEIKLDENFYSLMSSLEKEIANVEIFNNDSISKDISKKELKKEKRKNYRLQYGKNFQLNVLNKSLEVKNKVFDIINKIFAKNDKESSIEDFKNLLDVGFTEVEIKTIPQSIDQVIVGDLMRSRFDNPKIQFCMGFNQSKVPAENNDNTIIDDRMRDVLENNGISISQTTFETALNQRFYLYLVLTNPTDKLILTYPKLNINKMSDDKSSVITAIEKLFGKIVEDKGEKKFITNLDTKRIDKYSLGFYSNNDIYNFIAENMQTLRMEYDNSILNVNNLPVKKAIKQLSKREGKKFEYNFNNFFNKISRKDNTNNINSSLASELFNVIRKGTTASVSYIELYNRCPYQHFLDSTIKLRERSNFEISATDLGTYLHKVLELIFSDKKISLDKINDKVIEDKLSVADIENIKFQNLNIGKETFYGANKIKAVKNLCKKILRATIEFIKYARQNSIFDTISTEEEFSYKIDDITFVGKVDKIESKIEGKDMFINIIDYKSGKKKKTLSEEELKKGVSIQLLLYLDYCIEKRKDKTVENYIPCGAFYLWVDDKVKQIEKFSEIEKVKKEKMIDLSYDGLVSDNLDYVKKIKNTLENSDRKTAIYKEPSDSGFVITGIKFNNENKDLENNINKLIDNVNLKITESIKSIKEGNIKAEPFDEKNCKYCKYIDICRKERFFIDEDSRNDQNTSSE